MMRTTDTDHDQSYRGSFPGGVREDVYVHLAARVDPDARSEPARATERLREAISGLRPPLAAVADHRLVTSTMLFRNARLTELDSEKAREDRPAPTAPYDLAILIRLSNPEAVSPFLDTDQLREVLAVFHTHARGIVITPARNVGATADEPAAGRLNLIDHLPRHEEESEAAWPPDGWRNGRGPTLAQREILLPIDPASTPFRSITRAELDPVHARALVVAVVQGTPRGELMGGIDPKPNLLPHLYWELSVRPAPASLPRTHDSITKSLQRRHTMPTETNLASKPRRAANRHYDGVIAAEVRRLARQLHPSPVTGSSNPDNKTLTSTGSNGLAGTRSEHSPTERGPCRGGRVAPLDRVAA
jgi:hypothetical protein